MGMIASQITSLMIVYSTVYSDADQRKYQSPASLAFVPETGEFPAQMACNAESVSIWWRHHELCLNDPYIIILLDCQWSKPLPEPMFTSYQLDTLNKNFCEISIKRWIFSFKKYIQNAVCKNIAPIQVLMC